MFWLFFMLPLMSNSLCNHHRHYRHRSGPPQVIRYTTAATTTTIKSSTRSAYTKLPIKYTTIPKQPTNLLTTKATFYFRTNNDIPGCPAVQTFNDGNLYGPCFGGVKYTTASKYWAAILNGGNYCGKKINVYYNNKQLTLTVMDSCPGCTDNHVDMGLEALIELTGSKEAACAINTIQPIIKWGFVN